MNSKFNFTKEEQKVYDDLVSLLTEAIEPEIEKEEKRRLEQERQEKIKREIQRQKYLESLTPISLNEFIRRLKIVAEKYRKFIEFRKNDNVLFCSLNINFPNIIRQAQMTDNGLALAELIDKVEKTMDDMEVIKNMVEMNNEVIHKKIEEIKKQKSIQER
ncbi:MAG: hypothetical protein J6J27_00270 [Alphaproteobacteria bacterium]|nr:hypothetical protein [Alphaproteobacteria bacterium]